MNASKGPNPEWERKPLSCLKGAFTKKVTGISTNIKATLIFSLGRLNTSQDFQELEILKSRHLWTSLSQFTSPGLITFITFFKINLQKLDQVTYIIPPYHA